MFVHLRSRSTYSMLEGIGSLGEICKKVKSLGQDVLALTDLGGLYGVVDFYSTAKKYDVRPLIGVEIPFVEDLQHTKLRKSDTHPATITLLVKNKQGYHNLLKLVSASYDNSQLDIPLLDATILQKYGEGLVVLVGGMNSFAHKLLGTTQSLVLFENFFNLCVQSCGEDNCYIDITAQLYTDYPDLQKYNSKLISFARDRKISMVVSSAPLYPSASDKAAYEVALAIKDGKKAYDPDARKISGEYHHLLSEQEVVYILNKNGHGDIIEELLKNISTLVKQCTTDILLGQALFPKFEPSKKIRDLYEEHKKFLVE